MSTIAWFPRARAVAQVNTVTPANVEIGDIFTVTINTKSISFTATAATVANVTAGLVAAIAAAQAAETMPEWNEVTASDGTTLMRLTANTAGVPFTQTSSTTDGGGANTQTLTTATSTAATGPNHFDNANNWTGGVAPANGDTLIFQDSDIDCLYGLTLRTGDTLAAVLIYRSFTGKIGLPFDNANGYPEYRTRYLTTGITALTIGDGEGDGSSRININGEAVQTTITINATGTPESVQEPAVSWKGSHATNTVTVNRGSFGAAVLADETAAIDTLKIGSIESVDSDATVYIGPGVTLETVTQSGGAMNCNAAITTSLTMTAGTAHLNGTGAIAQLTLRGDAVCYYNTSGTLGGDTEVSDQATLDFERDMRSKTVTNPLNRYGREAKIFDDKKVTGALVIDYYGFGDVDGNVRWGKHVRLTRGSVA